MRLKLLVLLFCISAFTFAQEGKKFFESKKLKALVELTQPPEKLSAEDWFYKSP